MMIILCTGIVSSQLRSTFTYEEKPVLEWSDFTGEIPANARHMASANTGLGYEVVNANIDNITKPEIQVNAIFYASLSWKKELPSYSEPLLQHEQLHFLITELHARKLRKAYSYYRPVKNVKQEVDYIYRKFENDRLKMQAAYDRETGHGNDKNKQRDWEIFVNSELFKL
ncbi:DUF922 domain-containing protein [Nonlabens ponticola]|nr:DUF922 domain-containing protein [Nonlabens ponticola]